MSELSPSDPFVGHLLDGRYRIVRVIAHGSITTVYEATHVKIGRAVAIKVLRREMVGDPEVMDRFTNEARAVGSFGHPNIVECTDFGELPSGLPYLVLEYLEGHTLSDAIAAGGPLSIRRAVKIAMQIASALEAAHARGVIHRDLTSNNVFLTHTDSNPDHVKVLDFGISTFLSTVPAGRRTRQGLTMGTPEFMAPEQIADPDAVGPRVDIYALGVILYQMLAGRLPFGPLPLQTLLTRIVGVQPPPIEREDLPAALRAIVARALAKYPKDRFASMGELEAALGPLSTAVIAGGGSRYPTPPYGMPSPFVEAPAPAPVAAPIAAATPPAVRIAATPAPVAPALVAPAPAVPVAERITQPSVTPRSGRRLRAVVIVALAAALPVILFLRTRAPAPAEPAAVVAPVVPAAVQLEISSRTPQARVTFRGRTYPLPFRQEVRAGAQPEIIELTAPGREGRRFWPTVDRPVRLSAELVPGRGVVEATLDETEVALGEKAAEAAPAPAPVEHGAPAHAPPAPHKVVVARPKVAPRTAVAPPAVPAAVHPVAPSAAAPEPIAELVSDEPTERASAPKPKPPAPVVTTRPPATPAASSSTVSTPAATVDPAKTQAMVRAHLAEVRSCYERGKMDNPELKGRVTVRITIGPSGAVQATSVESSSLGNGRVESCVAETVRGWTFPAPTGGTAVISYPFSFR